MEDKHDHRVDYIHQVLSNINDELKTVQSSLNKAIRSANALTDNATKVNKPKIRLGTQILLSAIIKYIFHHLEAGNLIRI